MPFRVIASVAAAVLLMVAGSAPVSAETQTTRDAKGDVVYWESSTQTGGVRSANVDILRTRVRYENGSLVIRTLFQNLTARNTTVTKWVTSLHTYRFDTNPDRRGYEYLIFDARGENLNRKRPGADRYVACEGLSWRANLDTDITTLVIPRSCFREGERRVMKSKFEIHQTGPGRTPAGEGSYYMDTLEDTTVTGYVRHSQTS